ncbi:MAG: ABC transporter permease, partial [Candidatus Falkowbacteria bacterium]|nr:ABC transporter permease [Candidatus Falkowbacteria bacterium]
MQIRSPIKSALISMRSNKFRTALTVLGVVIGIASVIIVYSAGEGITQLIVGEVQSFGGPDMIETEIKVPSTKKGAAAEQQSAMSLAQGVQITTLTIKDMEDINKLPNIKNAYAGITDQEQISFGNEMRRAMIMGVSASFINIGNSKVDYGHFFTEEEDKSLEKVIVLGSKMKEKLFGDSDPLGKFVQVRKEKFRVIGIMKEQGAVMGFDFDDIAYFPVRTLQKRVMGIDHLMFMMHQVYDQTKIRETAEEMREIVRSNHDIASVPIDPTKTKNIGEDLTDTSKDDFRVVTMAESLSILSTVTGAITLLLLAIVAVSLVVGGVGIMNIMYVTVTERTFE